MHTDTKNLIIDFVKKNERVSAKSIIKHLGMTPAGVFRHLLKLTTDGILIKQGIPPKVFYSLKPKTYKVNAENGSFTMTGPPEALWAFKLDSDTRKVINEEFLKINPDGTARLGVFTFYTWCESRGLDPEKTAIEYTNTIEKFKAYKNDGLIDGMKKMKQTFPTVFLDLMYYLDFYSIERFGKTKLGEMILYAKQSQNKSLIRMITQEVKDKIEDMIKRYNVDAVGFIPPTIKRDVQFMKELELYLKLSVPSIKITKIKTPIIVPQKTLSKLEDRIENARQSIIVEEETSRNNILLIDDAIGSGATINEIARQIKRKELCKHQLIGLGLVGSFNGFEVIREA